METRKLPNIQLATILGELRRELDKLYGARLVELLLYGSQARGEAHANSDIDVMVVLSGDLEPWTEIERTGRVTASLSLKYDVVISCVYMSASRFYGDKNSPLLREVHRESIPL